MAILNQNGVEQDVYNLPEDIFAEPLNEDLLYQVVTVLEKRKQEPVAHTKGRSERRGGGRKPWRQKGTGRARHGSRRSPIWRKGGVTFGPSKERNPNTSLPKKMKRKAMRMVLTELVSDGELFVVDDISFGEARTKLGKQMLNNVLPNQKSTLVVLSDLDISTEKSLRNISYVSLVSVHSVSLEDFLQHDVVLTEPQVLDILSEKYREQEA